MNEDQRRSRDVAEPPKHAASGAERWIDYLTWQRESVITAVEGLSDDEQRRTRLPSGWTPIELLSHVLHMEQRWFVWGFLARPVDAPWGDWDAEDPNDPAVTATARWRVPDDVGVDVLAARLRALGEVTAAVLRSHGPQEHAAVGGRFSADPPTLEWICFHVLAEYARHAGQLDVVVELAGADRPTG